MTDGVEVGRAHVTVTADARGADKRLRDEFGRFLPDVGRKSSQDFSKSFVTGLKGGLKAAGLAGGIAAVGAGIVKGFGAAISSAGNFEKSMRLVAVTSGAGEDQLKSLTATAIDMGAKTSFSAQGASDAMVELAKGGLTAAQIQGGALEQTLTLATAGGLELGSAAGYMVSGLKAFGLQAADSGRVAAALAGGANASTASVESMGLALQQSAAQAATAGLSIEDTTGAIAALANNGIQGSDAGTSLKVMLQRLVPQTDKAKGSMEELGLITKDGANQFFDAQGNMKSMADVAGLLQNALKDQTKEQKINTLYRLFGSDATRAAAILTKEGASGLAAYTKATSDQNAAQALAQNATQGFAGAMERFKGSVETVGIQLGTKLLPVLTRFLNFLSGQAIPAMTAFAGVLSRHRVLIGALAVGLSVVVGPILLMVGAFKVAAIVARAWAAAQVLLNIALSANPIGIVVIALAALVAGLIFAWKHSETFRNVVLGVWAAVKGAVLAVVNWLVVNVPAAWHKITTVVSNVVSAVASVLKKAFMLWTLPMRLIMTAILTIMVLGWLAIRKPVTAAFNFIKNQIIIPVWNAIVGRFRTSMAIIRAAWTRFWALVRSGASIMWNFVLHSIIAPIWNRIKSVWTTASAAVRATWTRFWSAIKSATTPAINFVHDKIRTVLDRIKSAFRTAKDNIQRIWNGLKDVVSKPVRWVVDHVYNKPLVPVWNRVAGLVSGPKLATYASGGVEPGYTPGRDTHPIMVGGGEAIMRPEFTRAVGKDWVDRANRAARHGRARRFAQEGGVPGFAGGGVVDWLKGLAGRGASALTGFAQIVKGFYFGNLRKLAEKALNPAKGALDKVMPDSGVGKTLGDIGKKMISEVLDKIQAVDVPPAAQGQGAYAGPPGTGSRRRVRWHGGTFTERFRNTLAQAQKMGGVYINVLQGGFSRSVRASGTSHYGDAIDTSWNSRKLSGMRRAGIAAWHRTPAQGFPHHIHGVPLPGRGYPAGSGIWQAQDYLRGGNGLAAGGIAPPGWSVVGERGRELMFAPDGGRVFSNTDSKQMLGSGVTINGGQFGYDPQSIAREIIKEQRHKEALNPVFG